MAYVVREKASGLYVWTPHSVGNLLGAILFPSEAEANEFRTKKGRGKPELEEVVTVRLTVARGR
jgi:hypothetical protein